MSTTGPEPLRGAPDGADPRVQDDGLLTEAARFDAFISYRRHLQDVAFVDRLQNALNGRGKQWRRQRSCGWWISRARSAWTTSPGRVFGLLRSALELGQAGPVEVAGRISRQDRESASSRRELCRGIVTSAQIRQPGAGR